MNNTKIIGSIDNRVAQLTGIAVAANVPILIGDQNLAHMQSEHPADFAKYGTYIADILSSPTYIAKHPAKDSIEYIKVYGDPNSGDDHVLVAVRVTGNGNYFARTLFVMSPDKVTRYREKGAFLEY